MFVELPRMGELPIYKGLRESARVRVNHLKSVRGSGVDIWVEDSLPLSAAKYPSTMMTSYPDYRFYKSTSAEKYNFQGNFLSAMWARVRPRLA